MSGRCVLPLEVIPEDDHPVLLEDGASALSHRAQVAGAFRRGGRLQGHPFVVLLFGRGKAVPEGQKRRLTGEFLLGGGTFPLVMTDGAATILSTCVLLGNLVPRKSNPLKTMTLRHWTPRFERLLLLDSTRSCSCFSTHLGTFRPLTFRDCVRIWEMYCSPPSVLG